MIYAIGTHVHIRTDSEYYRQQFDNHRSDGRKMTGVILQNEYDGDGDDDYIYEVEWRIDGEDHSSNYYRIEDLEMANNISQVNNFKKDTDYLV